MHRNGAGTSRAILATLPPLAAGAVEWLLAPVIHPHVWFLFYPAIFLSSWIGGFAAGIRATLLSAFVVWWFFLPPAFTVAKPDAGNLFPLLVLLGTGVVFSWFHHRLRRTEQGYRDLFDQAVDGVFVTDARGRYLAVNDAGCRMLGYRREELLEKTLFELLPPEDASRLASTRDRLLRGEADVGEWSLLRKDGSWLPVEVSARILPDGRWQALARDISDRRRSEAALREHAERIHDLYNNAPCGYHSLDKDGVIIEINDTELRWLGRAREDVVGKVRFEDVLTADSKRLFRESFPRFLECGEVGDLEFELLCRDGQRLPVLLSATTAKDADGGYLMSRSILFDHSARKQAEEALRQAAIVFDSTNEAIMITDADGRIVKVNAAFSAITGFAADEVVGASPGLLRSGRHDAAFYSSLRTALERGGQWQGEIWNRRKDGEVFPVWESISAVKDAEERLTHLAHHDALTGLPNRLLFKANLEQSLENAKRHRRPLALLFLDLDRFKLINDTLGHAAGDELLKEIAERLRRSVRAQDTVARLGGDEFTITFEELPDPEEAAHLAVKIIAEVARPFLLGGRELVSSTSIGIAVFPDDADSAEGLTRAADAAMYRAKERGRNTYEFYTPDITARAREHLALEQGLRQALSNGDLELYFQPQFDLDSGRIAGAEALLRWNRAGEGTILPDRFIRVAEESGLIRDIGDWVIGAAFAQRQDWLQRGLAPVRVGINVSARQILHGQLVETVEAALRATGLQPRQALVELEITESVLQAMEQSAGVLRRLRALGFRIAIDDFGTGFSSLSLLKHLPVDTLKIDRVFVRNIPEDADSKAIVAAMISMSHALGLHVIAEGVETQGQLVFLRDYGCDEVQGNLLGAAMPAAALARLLGDGARRVGGGATNGAM